MPSDPTHRQARRRLKQLGKTLAPALNGWSDSEEDDLAHEVNVKSVRIGDVTMTIVPPKNPELVPEYNAPFYEGSQLGQDIFLIGPPGPLRRALVMKYAEMTQREIEYVALSKDVTDADLKQRRELQNGTSYYVDQAAVRAAIHGRILVLDGIEKAERNVLPILNNLLENREMSLDDGRFLTTKNPSEYGEGEKRFEKVDDRFLVFALGLPVPPYIGYPLDPPLRSRFQSRDIKTPSFQSQVDQMLMLTDGKVPRALIEKLISISSVLGIQADKAIGREVDIPEFPMTIESLASLLKIVPNANTRFLVDILYPYPLLPTCDLEQMSVIESAYRRFGVVSPVVEADSEARQVFSGYQLANVDAVPPPEVSIDGHQTIHHAIATFSGQNRPAMGIPLFSGPNEFSPAEFFVETAYHKDIFSSMVLIHAGGHDICLLGTQKGVGKSALVRHFARNLGYTIDYIPLYRDMSSRDLLQRRSTSPTGDTIWENSLLVEAAIHGHLAVLDGIEALSHGTLNTLQRLVSERETQLPDGARLINAHRYEKLMKKSGFTVEELEAKRLIPIHPSFRIIALARAGSNGQTDSKSGAWLTAEILSMFQFIVVDSLPSQEEQEVLGCLSPGVNEDKLKQLLSFARRLRRDKDDTVRMLSSALSTRQLIRICRRIAYFQDDDESLYIAVHKAALSRFMPTMAREALHELLVKNGIYPPKNEGDPEELKIEVLPTRDNPQHIRIGNVTEPVFIGGNPMLIPNVVFHENPAHAYILREMLKDYQLGEHLLLIGNQGVGKNKLVDYFLQLLQRPREYIQLHRDSTVQSLTTTPAIRDGVLVFEDSALVKAVRDGTILVVDEADKAPTYVTAVMKSLVEDGQMVLGDGRRIVSKEGDMQGSNGYILVHPMYLLRKYGPNVPEDLLDKLSSAFTDLRKLVDEGLISYPYSTRELVNIVIHLQSYPEEGISKTMQNVFDFDQYDQASKELLIEVFEKHGIPIGLESEFTMNLGHVRDLGEAVLTEQWSRLASPRASTSKVEVADIAIRGGWDIEVGKKWRALERKEGRSTVFSEQLYTFTIPTRGEALDIAALEDGTLFVVTTNPVTLHRIEPRHQNIDSLDLYEYFPLQRAPPRLRIAIVSSNGHSRYVALHNPSNNELLCCDFAKNTVASAVIRGLEPLKSIMLSDLSSSGILVFYQEDQPTIAVLDFNTSKQYTLTLNVRINQLFVLEPSLWIARGSRDATLYALYPESQGMNGVYLPTLSEPIQVLGQNGHHVSDIEQIFELIPGQGIRFAHHGVPAKFGSLLRGCTEKEFIHGNGKIDVLAYLNPALENARVPAKIKSSALYLKYSNQLAVVRPSMDGRPEGNLELLDSSKNQLWTIKIPLATAEDDSDFPVPTFAKFQIERPVVTMCELSNGHLVTMDNAGIVRVWQVNAPDLYNSAQTWKKMVGVDQKILSIIYETDQKGEIDTSMEGLEGQQEDQGGQKGSGGSGGEGSGGSGGEGSGGSSGTGEGEGGDGEGASGGGFNGAGGRMNENGRQEATFEDIQNLKLKTAEDKPESVTEAQRLLHEESMEKLLGKIQMSQGDFQAKSVEAKNKERVWLKNQASGDLDDAKIIEGLTGEKAIYKKRGEDDPEIGLFQEKPKQMSFVFDLSASMFRFNTHDRRLERSMEVALMLMESFRGFESKFAYRIVGHSGDGANIEFVTPSNYPKTEKEAFEVINKMRAHSQYCLSGDNTLGAAAHAVKEIVKEEGDDYLVAILSDANIAQYNIHPNDIARVLKSDDRVTAQMIFIGSLQDQAEQLKKALGNHAHICAENKDLPKIIKALFLASMVK
ncbi:von Willebrand factor A domain-containing protein 8 [Apophysomyces ossiformis]|uniref:von Willebrand factor A domain-containing protein 8 n=1 Tax=Apophysomyces ossiformis TaxID=679940 RepID=A0A8H7BWX8_9FUNG|nr:von Willebrand factor A domain-containing protein 8 [Apophysomyces ossiformis]